MNLSLSSRLSVVAMAAVALGTTFGATMAPQPTSAATAYYIATLAEPAGETSAVAGGVAWACKDNMCVANKGSSRPMRICRGLSRQFGEVKSFMADGEALPDEKLAKCNGE
ncbi:MAG: hypothetical protein V2I27_08475 [Erythrobacter sp.]|jgi:hypothetical protein|nr:hypothetical protein [Erythrobacter sp.]